MTIVPAEPLVPVAPTFVREDARGTFIEVLNRGPWETVLLGRMHTGAILGNHYHKHTSVFIYLIRGSAEVVQVDVRTLRQSQTQVAEGAGLLLEPWRAHAIRFAADAEVLALKSRAFDAEDSDTYAFDVPATTHPTV